MYRIAQETGVSASTLSRFMSGASGIRCEVLDRLGEFLRMEVKTKGPRPEVLRAHEKKRRPR